MTTSTEYMNCHGCNSPARDCFNCPDRPITTPPTIARIETLESQLAAQRAIVAADDKLHRRLAVDIGTVGPSVRLAWGQACDARDEAKRIDKEAGE